MKVLCNQLLQKFSHYLDIFDFLIKSNRNRVGASATLKMFFFPSNIKSKNCIINSSSNKIFSFDFLELQFPSHVDCFTAVGGKIVYHKSSHKKIMQRFFVFKCCSACLSTFLFLFCYDFECSFLCVFKCINFLSFAAFNY